MAVEPIAKRRKLVSQVNGETNGSPGFTRWNLEQDYENRPRKKNKKEAKNDKLPVKTPEGWKENQRYAEEDAGKDEEKDSFLASDEETETAAVEVPEGPKVETPKLPPKEQIRQAKETLARVAGNISEDPEENIGQLGALGELSKSENFTVRKLALGTQLAVFKDIIPGYRIRPLAKDDLGAKVSKDVRRLRTFEQGLLSGYKGYVDILRKYAGSRSNPDAASVSSVAMACICTLLTTVPHFNFRNELIAVVIRKLSTRKVDADFVKCRSALEQVFQEDEEGHTTLEVVKELTKTMKARDFQIHESVLNMFLHLRLLSEFSHKASTNSVDKDAREDAPKMKGKQKREFRTKRERKVLREKKEIEKEMKVADASVSFEERDKNQSETLKLVFVAYFRILKGRVQHLMGAVLEGLAKYSHLINQDFFGDILEALKDLINEAEAVLQRGGEDEEDEEEEEEELDATTERNVSREALLCIITAFALLQGQTEVVKSATSLSLDLTFFITHLYRTLLPLSMNADIELSAKTAHMQDPNGLDVPTAKDSRVNVSTTTVLLLRSLQGVLLPPTNTKAVPPGRIAAFIKQLMTLALHLPQKSAIAVLGLLNQVTKTHSGKVAALWNTEERKGDGVFDPLSDRVEASNPFASTAWEGELLKLHFDPTVREAVKGIEKNVVLDTR